MEPKTKKQAELEEQYRLAEEDWLAASERLAEALEALGECLGTDVPQGYRGLH